ncbi:MAG: hypothetical protein ACOYK8_10455 [Alphaproteobacteria bacterium]
MTMLDNMPDEQARREWEDFLARRLRGIIKTPSKLSLEEIKNSFMEDAYVNTELCAMLEDVRLWQEQMEKKGFMIDELE